MAERKAEVEFRTDRTQACLEGRSCRCRLAFFEQFAYTFLYRRNSFLAVLFATTFSATGTEKQGEFRIF